MPTYQLNIKIDDKHLKKFHAAGMKLCFSTSVSSGRQKISFRNIVARAKKVTPKMSIQWTDEWKIGAADTEVSDGVMPICSSEMMEVKFGDRFLVNHAWESSITHTDDPKRINSFIFFNERIDAAAILYRNIDSDYRTAYYSHAGPITSGFGEILTPNTKVYLWFSDTYEEGVGIDDYEGLGPVLEIDMNGKTKVAVEFSKDAKWVVV